MGCQSAPWKPRVNDGEEPGGGGEGQDRHSKQRVPTGARALAMQQEGGQAGGDQGSCSVLRTAKLHGETGTSKLGRRDNVHDTSRPTQRIRSCSGCQVSRRPVVWARGICTMGQSHPAGGHDLTHNKHFIFFCAKGLQHGWGESHHHQQARQPNARYPQLGDNESNVYVCTGTLHTA